MYTALIHRQLRHNAVMWLARDPTYFAIYCRCYSWLPSRDQSEHDLSKVTGKSYQLKAAEHSYETLFHLLTANDCKAFSQTCSWVSCNILNVNIRSRLRWDGNDVPPRNVSGITLSQQPRHLGKNNLQLGFIQAKRWTSQRSLEVTFYGNCGNRGFSERARDSAKTSRKNRRQLPRVLEGAHLSARFEEERDFSFTTRRSFDIKHRLLS